MLRNIEKLASKPLTEMLSVEFGSKVSNLSGVATHWFRILYKQWMIFTGIRQL